MKKGILLIVFGIGLIGVSHGQKLKDKLNQVGKKESTKENEDSKESSGLPKGLEVYNQEHSDPTGMSGKYYLLDPIYIEVNRKGFYMNEVTIEYRPESYNGLFHWINDEVNKGHRFGDANMSTLADFYGPTGVAQINTKLIDKYGNFSFKTKTEQGKHPGGTKYQGFKDVNLVRYSKDPDILILSDARVFESQNCIPVYQKGNTYDALRTDSRWEYGQQYNILSKDPAKLKDIDSLTLVEIAIEASTKLCSDIVSIQSEDRGLPAQGVNNDTFEKELYDLIKPMAAADKPIAWADKFEYVYVHTDWKVFYKDKAKTIIDYRVCSAIATSCGWPIGECRYIAVHIKQEHNGTEYGPKQLGFGGSLIPVSKEKVKSFSH